MILCYDIQNIGTKHVLMAFNDISSRFRLPGEGKFPDLFEIVNPIVMRVSK